MKKITIISKKYKKYELILLSFLIPLIVYTTIFYINGLLTDKTILMGDSYAQYYPLFMYLKNIFNGTSSIFYSFSKGLGGTMYGTIFYYLSSPLNLLIVFVDKNHVPDFITCLMILKLSLCGLTMYTYMRRKFKKDNMVLLAFSTCYAFMGYNINYFSNIMWLDVVVLAPIVLIGIDKIIEGKSPKLYIITLFISILSNYYLAYMLCLFCVIYFIYEALIRYDIKKDKIILKNLTKKFIISSLLAGFMCSFFLIPCIEEMLNYGRNSMPRNVMTINPNFFDLFTKTYMGTLILNDTLNPSSLNVYCGVIVLPLIYFYIFNEKINKKEKKLTLMLILIMILPCFIGLLNYIWHLFTLPIGYSYRFSFLLCLFLIRIAYKTYENIKPNIKEILLYLLLYLIISIMLIIITYYGNYYMFLNYKLIWLTLIFLMLYLIILYKKLNKKNAIIVILIFLECTLNIYIIFNRSIFPSRDSINNKFERIINENNDKRIEIIKEDNSSLIYNYRGVNMFLSTTNAKSIKILSKIGKNYDGYNNGYNAKYQSLLVDDMFGLRTMLMTEDNKIKKLDIKEKLEDLNVYENKNAFSIGYIIKNECNNLEFNMLYDQKVFNCIFDKNIDFYKTLKSSKQDDNKMIYETKRDTTYYISYEAGERQIDEIFGDNSKNVIYKKNNVYMIKNPDNNLEISISENMDKENVKVYYFDYKKYNEIIENMKLEQLDYEIKKDKLFGKIKTKGGLLLITIPYEKGYNIYVDNKLTDYKIVLDSLIGVDLTEGEHDIRIEYKQPGLKPGIILTVISSSLAILYIRKNKNV